MFATGTNVFFGSSQWGWPRNADNRATNPSTATTMGSLEIASITILIIVTISSVMMSALVLRYAFLTTDSHVVSQVLFAQSFNQALLLLLSGTRKGEEIVHCAMKVIEKIGQRFI